MGLYLRPGTVREAVAALAARPMTVLAGATDFYPARGEGAADLDILDISGIGGAIALEGGYWRIPAGATWSDVIAAGLPGQFDGLVAAARQVGGRQVQNAGTVVGNLVNASPAADGIPCLLALDAEVEIAWVGGVRRLPVGEFVLGPRRTALAAGELVSAILVPAREGARGGFLKLGARRYLVISIAMVAVVVEVTEGVISHVRLAVGACGPVAMRVPEAEVALLGHRPDPGRLMPAHFAGLAPIDDIRASAAYRRHAALELARRAVAGLAV